MELWVSLGSESRSSAAYLTPRNLADCAKFIVYTVALEDFRYLSELCVSLADRMRHTSDSRSGTFDALVMTYDETALTPGCAFQPDLSSTHRAHCTA